MHRSTYPVWLDVSGKSSLKPRDTDITSTHTRHVVCSAREPAVGASGTRAFTDEFYARLLFVLGLWHRRQSSTVDVILSLAGFSARACATSFHHDYDPIATSTACRSGASLSQVKLTLMVSTICAMATTAALWPALRGHEKTWLASHHRAASIFALAALRRACCIAEPGGR